MTRSSLWNKQNGPLKEKLFEAKEHCRSPWSTLLFMEFTIVNYILIMSNVSILKLEFMESKLVMYVISYILSQSPHLLGYQFQLKAIMNIDTRNLGKNPDIHAEYVCKHLLVVSSIHRASAGFFRLHLFTYMRVSLSKLHTWSYSILKCVYLH